MACKKPKKMDSAKREGFLRFLRDPRAYRLGLLRHRESQRRGCEAMKRKYSVEMRQKATIREKNRIRSIGKEFCKLANLLPDSCGMKRSHQRILQDTVAYIRALEVELNIIDEDAILGHWSEQNEQRSKEAKYKDDEESNEEYCTPYEEVENGLLNKQIMEAYQRGIKYNQCTPEVSPSYDYISNEADHESFSKNVTNYRSILGGKLKEHFCKEQFCKEHYCAISCTEVEKQLLKNALINGSQVKMEVEDGYDAHNDNNDFDEYEGYGDYDENRTNSEEELELENKSIDEADMACDSNEHENEKEHLSFDKVVTGLKFHL